MSAEEYLSVNERMSYPQVVSGVLGDAQTKAHYSLKSEMHITGVGCWPTPTTYQDTTTALPNKVFVAAAQACKLRSTPSWILTTDQHIKSK